MLGTVSDELSPQLIVTEAIDAVDPVGTDAAIVKVAGVPGCTPPVGGVIVTVGLDDITVIDVAVLAESPKASVPVICTPNVPDCV
ncbi:MAG: hypothetical protein JF610_11095 [Acidobacteria bacterium]|nr:hypothetical protein [Acidobacteriota bacterium]